MKTFVNWSSIYHKELSFVKLHKKLCKQNERTSFPFMSKCKSFTFRKEPLTFWHLYPYKRFHMLLASINSATLPCKSSKQLSELYSQSNMFISYVNPWFHLAVYVTGLLWKHFKWLLLYFWAISRGLMVDQFIFVSGTKIVLAKWFFLNLIVIFPSLEYSCPVCMH